jgi:hypothetical protein
MKTENKIASAILRKLNIQNELVGVVGVNKYLLVGAAGQRRGYAPDYIR